ncbi:hypothetical protein D1007_37203 [Hordeum vulgare]|nr:hypothetical protein D1007_37203 [Hordeum vulgare]
MKMLSDPEIVKDVHLYVSKEKVGDDVAPPSKQFDIAPSDHPNESDIAPSNHPQRPLRRSKRLNVIQVTDQCDDDDGDYNNCEQFVPGHEAEALDNEQDQDHNQVDKEVRKRKRTNLPIVSNMPKGQRIVVKCNENSQPIGDEGAILGKFLGTIARNGGFCPLNINDWRGVKKNSGEETILQCVQTKFVYPRSCEKWILKSIGRDWRKYKSSLKDAFFKPVIGKNPNIKRKALYKLCPEDVDIDQWRGLVKFWKSKKERALAEKNIISRSLVKNSHNAGTKSFACWSEDMRQADPEKKRPHRSQVYLATHKKKDGANAENIDRNERLENVQSNANGISRLPILHGQRKRIQCNEPVEARSSMQDDISEDLSLSRLHEKAGDHDVTQLQIQQNSSLLQDLVIDSVPEVRKMRDPTGESFSRQNQHGTRTEHPHARSRKRHTSTIKAGSKVVLKTSTYPNKRNIAYGTIRSTDPRTKACGIELGAEFALVRIDQPLLDIEELVREVSDCKTIGEAFSSGYLIAWPSTFIREKDN